MPDYAHPSRALLESIDIHTLLPQQEPFVMIDRIVGFDEKFTITETLIAADNIFVEDGRFTATGLIENIAQTCAARIGYINKYIYNKEPRIGFIGAVRNLSVTDTPQVGQVITTTVEVLEDVFGMTLADTRVACGDNTLVTAQFKIAVEKGGEEA